MRRPRRNGPKEDAERYLYDVPKPIDVAHLEDWLVAAAEAGREGASEALESLARGTPLETVWEEWQIPLLHAVDIDLSNGFLVRPRVQKLLKLHRAGVRHLQYGMGVATFRRNYLWEAAELLGGWMRVILAGELPYSFVDEPRERADWASAQLLPKSRTYLENGLVVFTEDQAELFGLEPSYHYRVITTERTPPDPDRGHDDWSESEVVDDGEDTVGSLEELAHLARDHYYTTEWSDSVAAGRPTVGSWLMSYEDTDYTTGAVREMMMRISRYNHNLCYVELAALDEFLHFGVLDGPLVGKWAPKDEQQQYAFNTGLRGQCLNHAGREAGTWFQRGLRYAQAMRDLKKRMQQGGNG